MGVKRPAREADHSLPSSAEIKNEWNYMSTPSIRLHGAVLSKRKHKDNFSFLSTPPPPHLIVLLVI
jgi:hypothetical protein